MSIVQLVHDFQYMLPFQQFFKNEPVPTGAMFGLSLPLPGGKFRRLSARFEYGITYQ